MNKIDLTVISLLTFIGRISFLVSKNAARKILNKKFAVDTKFMMHIENFHISPMKTSMTKRIPSEAFYLGFSTSQKHDYVNIN